MLKAKDEDVARDYLPTIEAYLSGQLPIEQFEQNYWAKCQAEERLFSDRMQELIWSLQGDFEFLELDDDERAKLNAEEEAKLPGNPRYYSDEERRKQKDNHPPNSWTYLSEKELRERALRTAEALRALL